jgi:hypothetical protein
MRSGAFHQLCMAMANAVLIWILGAGPSWAQAKDEHLFVSGTDLKTVLFGSLDAGRSSFVTLGAKQTWSGPLDRSGFVSLATVGYGENPARTDLGAASSTAVRPTVQASAMIGYQWALDRLFVAGFIGPEVDAQQPATIGEIPRLSQPRLGLRVQGEVWAHPTENTLLAATVVAGTARSQLWGRTAFRLPDLERRFRGAGGLALHERDLSRMARRRARHRPATRPPDLRPLGRMAERGGQPASRGIRQRLGLCPDVTGSPAGKSAETVEPAYSRVAELHGGRGMEFGPGRCRWRLGRRGGVTR